jgi:hypothetical protein
MGASMIEMLGGGVIGSLIGGLFRLAPEFLKWLDRKNERAHELAMFGKQCELEAQRGQQKLAEIGAQREAALDTGVIDAFKSAIEQQTHMTKAAGGWAARLSASVRPVVTYALVGVYLAMQIVMAAAVIYRGGSIDDVFRFVMTPDFVALVAGILNYHFLNRTLEKRSLL